MHKTICFLETVHHVVTTLNGHNHNLNHSMKQPCKVSKVLVIALVSLDTCEIFKMGDLLKYL